MLPYIKYLLALAKALANEGKVSIGRVRYLLSIMFYTFRCSNHLFSVVSMRASLVYGRACAFVGLIFSTAQALN